MVYIDIRLLHRHIYLPKPDKVLLMFVSFIVCKVYRKIKIKITIGLAKVICIINYLGHRFLQVTLKCIKNQVA